MVVTKCKLWEKGEIVYTRNCFSFPLRSKQLLISHTEQKFNRYTLPAISDTTAIIADSGLNSFARSSHIHRESSPWHGLSLEFNDINPQTASHRVIPPFFCGLALYQPRFYMNTQLYSAMFCRLAWVVWQIWWSGHGSEASLICVCSRREWLYSVQGDSVGRRRVGAPPLPLTLLYHTSIHSMRDGERLIPYAALILTSRSWKSCRRGGGDSLLYPCYLKQSGRQHKHYPVGYGAVFLHFLGLVSIQLPCLCTHVIPVFLELLCHCCYIAQYLSCYPPLSLYWAVSVSCILPTAGITVWTQWNRYQFQQIWSH